jgi:hypothetical protein
MLGRMKWTDTGADFVSATPRAGAIAIRRPGGCGVSENTATIVAESRRSLP